MNVTLMHNPGAGGENRPEAPQLIEALEREGHAVTYQSTKEPGAQWALLDPGDLVIAAGGDGTVRKIALALFGRGVPMTILPLGTANNMAKSLGITGSLGEIVKGLKDPRSARMDVGLAEGPWGKKTFVESAGAGVLARTISYMSNEEDDGGPTAPVEDSRKRFEFFLQRYVTQSWEVQVDGKSLPGEYLFAEAMNMRLVGPNLHLAPEGKSGDGIFDFAFLRKEDRESFLSYLDEYDTRKEAGAPVQTLRGRCLRLTWAQREPIHIDDYTWPQEKRQKKKNKKAGLVTVTFSVVGKPLDILVPRLNAK
jgi:diacylglycerol kinase (ATP)